jgi:predicted nucleic acid-binding protein
LTIVDTSVLSLAFRRRARKFPEPEAVRKLRALITDNRPVLIPGIVLQELLSGVRTSAEFERLRQIFEGFPVLLASQDHHVTAARIANACIQAGVLVSTVDCLIAAITLESDARLLTTDRDFVLMAPHCGLKLLD